MAEPIRVATYISPVDGQVYAFVIQADGAIRCAKTGFAGKANPVPGCLPLPPGRR